MHGVLYGVLYGVLVRGVLVHGCNWAANQAMVAWGGNPRVLR